jgi:hypothetical protein
MTRSRKIALFLTLAIVGGLGIELLALPVFGRVHNAAPDMARIVAGTLVTAFAMAWAFFFATRAHGAKDEYKRQREISAGYWGGWMGIAASAPLFFLFAVTDFLNPATVHIRPLIVFAFGYLLAPICGFIGTVTARLWLYRGDRLQ